VKLVENGPSGENCRLGPAVMVTLTGMVMIGFETALLGAVTVTTPFQVSGRFVRFWMVAVLMLMVTKAGVAPVSSRVNGTAVVPPLICSHPGGPLFWLTVAVAAMVQGGVAGLATQALPPEAGGALRVRLTVALDGVVLVPLFTAVKVNPAAGAVEIIVGRDVTVRVTMIASGLGWAAGVGGVVVVKTKNPV